MSNFLGEKLTKHQRETHPSFVDGCFACKVSTLQLNAGDATRDISDKKWVGEIDAYKQARAEGIQPGGTTRKAVEDARRASETLGRAYNAESMPKADKINDRTAALINYIDTGKEG